MDPPRFTQRLRRHAGPELESDETLLAGVAIQLKGTRSAQSAGRRAGIPGSSSRRAWEARCEEGAAMGLAVTPFLALGLTQRRLLVYRRSNLFRILKECLGSFSLTEVDPLKRGRFHGKRGELGNIGLIVGEHSLALEGDKHAFAFVDYFDALRSGVIPLA